MNPVAAGWPRHRSARSADAPPLAERLAAAGVAVPAIAIGAIAIALRIAFAPQFDGLDDAGYLDAARRVAAGASLADVFPLFRTRTGMAYPMGWLMQVGWLRPDQFWILTLIAESIAVVSLATAGALLTGWRAAGLWAAALYAIYPLAVQQSMMFYPTAFQVAAVALAVALIARAEQAQPRARLLLGAAAGLVLGIGYLFKEDVAIVVIMIAIASVIARYPRPSTTVAICAGAAAVFAAECIGYWQTTGNPLFRLTASSGLGAPGLEQLRLAEIWRWDAFLRSLLLLPAQVGLMWWAGAVATAIALIRYRRESRGLYFAAVVFVLVMAFLQFGSGSFTSYSPLPKTPRYTALATPLLMLVVGAWLARVQAVRPRLAWAVIATIAAAAIPCVFYLQLSSGERTRNTLAVVPVLKELRVENLYTDYYGTRVLRLLQPHGNVRVWYHAKFDTQQMVVVDAPSAAPGSFALLDHQAAKIYTSSYEMQLPESIDNPPADWEPVWRRRAFSDDSVTRRVLEGLRRIATRLPEGNSLRGRIDRTVVDMIEGDDAVLYRLPSP